ncbi:hypothetical protein C0Z11_12310 [Acidipropionibacterium jensenii]|nr:hypothetical protein C0Z11_12310 [Acidipropionibacterium jensenii]
MSGSTDRCQQLAGWKGQVRRRDPRRTVVHPPCPGGIPAYAAIIVDALADGGVQQGLKRPVARRLVLQSLLGSAQLMLETDLGPGDLKDAVCSPAGTTIEGVRAIERAGVRSGLIEAVIAASQRAAELK